MTIKVLRDYKEGQRIFFRGFTYIVVAVKGSIDIYNTYLVELA